MPNLAFALQVGDQLDRGDNEVQILYFLERLQKEAADAGGALHILNGNHETMNVGGRFRYATTPGRIDFLRWQLVESIGAGLKVSLCIVPQSPVYDIIVLYHDRTYNNECGTLLYLERSLHDISNQRIYMISCGELLRSRHVLSF